ncbi:hypothetical protein N8I77_000871 [Diaporthe amygdali]|uniref:Uncharacterized protein n=1 Tax=Phomopsis amygdali TaxID=1214568 RepID=A0AAD9SQL6_PHOAM|nr:hypothetical protein N8I77_000871 [Diaporthe amygdali]
MIRPRRAAGDDAAARAALLLILLIRRGGEGEAEHAHYTKARGVVTSINGVKVVISQYSTVGPKEWPRPSLQPSCKLVAAQPMEEHVGLCHSGVINQVMEYCGQEP